MPLTFHLAGINNQNFLMRDEQTGSYWQQITGACISGRLAGRHLQLISADELTFGLWRQEEPQGTVLSDSPGHIRDYAPKNWDKRMAKAPTVINYAQPGLKARDLMLGVRAFGASRAYPYETVLKEQLVEDNIGSEPVMLVVGPDGKSVRVFRRRMKSNSVDPDFYWVPGGSFLDATTGSTWNFQGCAVKGPLTGTCLEHVEAIKDYWFDWRNYNPQTTVYGIHHPIR